MISIMAAPASAAKLLCSWPQPGEAKPAKHEPRLGVAVFPAWNRPNHNFNLAAGAGYLFNAGCAYPIQNPKLWIRNMNQLCVENATYLHVGRPESTNEAFRS